MLESRGVRDLVVVDDRAYAGTGAGLHVSEDGGESWAAAGLADREVWQIRSAGGDTLYAATQPAGLFRSDDAGSTWYEIESFAALPEAADWCVPIEPPAPGRARALVIDAEDPDRIWVGVEVGGIARTDDGGDSWTVDLPGDNPDLHMMWAHPDQAGVLFASTGYGRFDGVAEMVEPNAGVFRSDDYGASWTYAWVGITPRYSRPMCIDDRAPFALTVASAPTAFSPLPRGRWRRSHALPLRGQRRFVALAVRRRPLPQRRQLPRPHPRSRTAGRRPRRHRHRRGLASHRRRHLEAPRRGHARGPGPRHPAFLTLGTTRLSASPLKETDLSPTSLNHMRVPPACPNRKDIHRSVDYKTSDSGTLRLYRAFFDREPT